jgi:hypothetical protein
MNSLFETAIAHYEEYQRLLRTSLLRNATIAIFALNKQTLPTIFAAQKALNSDESSNKTFISVLSEITDPLMAVFDLLDRLSSALNKLIQENQLIQNRALLIDNLLDCKTRKDQVEEGIEKQKTTLFFVSMRADTLRSRQDPSKKPQKTYQRAQETLDLQKKQIETALAELENDLGMIDAEIDFLEVMLEPVPVMADIF